MWKAGKTHSNLCSFCWRRPQKSQTNSIFLSGRKPSLRGGKDDSMVTEFKQAEPALLNGVLREAWPGLCGCWNTGTGQHPLEERVPFSIWPQMEIAYHSMDCKAVSVQKGCLFLIHSRMLYVFEAAQAEKPNFYDSQSRTLHLCHLGEVPLILVFITPLC